MFHKAILLFVVLSIAASPALAAKVDLSGQVTYRERIALPAGATLGIELVDQTLPNAPPRVAVAAPIGPGQVPLSFDLKFEDSLILPNHDYALIASISVDHTLLFRNFEPYGIEPLAPAGPILIVTNLVGHLDAGPSSAQPEAPVTPTILESTWTATSINGAPPLPRSNTSLAIGADMRAGGTGGCNSWFAQVRLDGDTLAFGAVTSTLKACSQSINQQEKTFFDALAAAATWQVSGDTLTLYGADGKALLMFAR